MKKKTKWKLTLKIGNNEIHNACVILGIYLQKSFTMDQKSPSEDAAEIGGELFHHVPSFY